MTQKMIFSKELNMMLVPIKIACPLCRGKKFIFTPDSYTDAIKNLGLVYDGYGKTQCTECKGEGFYTVNHL